MKKIFYLVLLFILTFNSYRTLLRPGYFPMHDDMQAMRVLQMQKCFSDFQIPCRWVPDMGYGYGYPQFNFYGPLPYYVMYGFDFLGFPILTSVKIGFILTVLISAIGMFYLGSYLFGDAAGFISSLFFIYSPYRAVDMYVRGAVGEFWALSFLPFVFLYSKKIIDQKDKKSFYLLSLFLSCIFLSHNITIIITLPVLALWICLLFLLKIKHNKLKIKSVFDLGISLLGGLLISSFFVVPAFFEKKYVHIETMLSGYFDYRRHFVSLSQLLFRNFWGFGGSEIGRFDEFSFNIGIFHWLIPTLCVFLILFFYKRKNILKENVFYFIFFYLMGWLALFMAHLRSIFVWEKISLLHYFQFPWRFLTLATFSFSLSAGYIISFIKNQKLKIYTSFLLISILFLFNLNFFRTKDWLNITDKQKFTGQNWDLQQTISIFDYLPKSANFPPSEKAPDSLISQNKFTVLSFEKGSNKQIWRIEVDDNNTEISLPIYNYPGWTVFVDNEKINVYQKGDLGLVTFKIDSGVHEIYAILKNTRLRFFSNMLSVTGFIILVFYFKKYIKYD